MDSLTQFALGGVVGCVVLKDTSKKTILISGLVATIPDLDVFLKPFYADGNFVLVHRSFSHSIFCSWILSVILAKSSFAKKSFAQKFNFYFWILFTHSLLDCCTTYGTQLFWPFNRQLISFNNIHVLEPIYTLSLLVPLCITFFSKKNSGKNLKPIYLAVLLSSAYLGWTFVSKTIAKQRVIDSLNQQKISYQKLLITPTPLNSLLWKAIVQNDSIYHFGSYSLFDKKEQITFHKQRHHPELLANIENYCDVETMLRHCDGFPLVEGDEENIRVYAIKFGPANYVGEPKFIMPFQATKSKEDYDFKIIDNRFESNQLQKFNQELLNRLKGK